MKKIILTKTKIMFKAPFSFDGRIRRSEYGISFIIYVVVATVLQLLIVGMASSSSDAGGMSVLFLLLLLPCWFFLLAQGAKRCHDLGNSGWFQLIPFYGFWMLFADSKPGMNEYGENPKGIGNTHFTFEQQQAPVQTGAGYQGQYNGGHNNPSGTNHNSNFSTGNSNDGYKSGDMYR